MTSISRLFMVPLFSWPGVDSNRRKTPSDSENLQRFKQIRPYFGVLPEDGGGKLPEAPYSRNRHPAASLGRGTIELATVWSRRAAAILASQLANSGADLRRTGLLAISPAAAEPLETSGFRQILVAETPDSAAMLTGIRAFFAPEPD
jgi:hypothetical protein